MLSPKAAASPYGRSFFEGRRAGIDKHHLYSTQKAAPFEQLFG